MGYEPWTAGDRARSVLTASFPNSSATPAINKSGRRTPYFGRLCEAWLASASMSALRWLASLTSHGSAVTPCGSAKSVCNRSQI